jgi:site-specific recombinase XerD
VTALQTKTQTQTSLNTAQTSLIALYKIHLIEKGLTERTTGQYLSPIRGTAKLLGGEERFLTATEADLRVAAAERIARRNGTGMDNWYYEMKKFFDFLISQGLREDNPLPPGFLKLFSGETLATRRDRILKDKLPAPDFNRLRDRAILALLQNTNLRPQEMQVMTLGCYDQKLGHLRLRARNRVILSGSTAEAMDEYVSAFLLSVPALVTANTLLFINASDGSALPESEYWNVIRRSLRDTG